MTKEIQIILIGNYPADKVESMDRFAHMLLTEFKKAGIKTEFWQPKVFFGTYAKSTISGFGKWLGYIDKWIINPFILHRYVRKKISRKDNVYFHVCDHSNSPYLKYLPANQSGVTCHDVIAIRGALGYADAYNPASIFGKILQKWIRYYLTKVKFAATVSVFTLNQLKELRTEETNNYFHWKVIYNSFNADFKPMAKKEVDLLLSRTGKKFNKPFLLHVGSRLMRKNRKLLLDMVALLAEQWDGNICYAGEAIDTELSNYARSFGLEERIISVEKPDHLTLVALYNAATVFIFPSFSEGFGWPVIEAQACGTPVIASNIEPLMEVSGGTALHADPTKPDQFAEAFLSLKSNVLRSEVIEKGFKNTLRFKPEKMVDAYLDLYGVSKKHKLREYVS